MRGVKLSVSLPDEDVDFLDAYAQSQGLQSRSAALQRAVAVLRTSGLGLAYEAAWSEWAGDEDAALWDSVAADGLG